jgi:hypothetical protein
MSVTRDFFGDKVFPKDRCKTMLGYRELLDFYPSGIPSRIAKAAGCGRQYVSQILNSEHPFTEKSDTAIKIWLELESILSSDFREGEEKNEILLRIREFKHIINSVKAGNQVRVKTKSPDYRFLVRRFSKLGIPVLIERDNSTIPTTYVFRKT